MAGTSQSRTARLKIEREDFNYLTFFSSFFYNKNIVQAGFAHRYPVFCRYVFSLYSILEHEYKCFINNFFFRLFCDKNKYFAYPILFPITGDNNWIWYKTPNFFSLKKFPLWKNLSHCRRRVKKGHLFLVYVHA